MEGYSIEHIDNISRIEVVDDKGTIITIDLSEDARLRLLRLITKDFGEKTPPPDQIKFLVKLLEYLLCF